MAVADVPACSLLKSEVEAVLNFVRANPDMKESEIVAYFKPKISADLIGVHFRFATLFGPHIWSKDGHAFDLESFELVPKAEWEELEKLCAPKENPNEQLPLVLGNICGPKSDVVKTWEELIHQVVPVADHPDLILTLQRQYQDHSWFPTLLNEARGRAANPHFDSDSDSEPPEEGDEDESSDREAEPLPFELADDKSGLAADSD